MQTIYIKQFGVDRFQKAFVVSSIVSSSVMDHPEVGLFRPPFSVGLFRSTWIFQIFHSKRMVCVFRKFQSTGS